MRESERLLQLLQELQASGFRDVAGARVSVTLPVSDRLVSRLVADIIPPNIPVRDVDVRALAGNRLSVKARITRPVLMPPITVNLAIEQQPQLPDRPILVVRLLSTGILSFARVALNFLHVLPPGIRMERDLLFINIQTLLEQRGLAEHLRHVDTLDLNTDEGHFVVDIRGGIAAGK